MPGPQHDDHDREPQDGAADQADAPEAREEPQNADQDGAEHDGAEQDGAGQVPDDAEQVSQDDAPDAADQDPHAGPGEEAGEESAEESSLPEGTPEEFGATVMPQDPEDSPVDPDLELPPIAAPIEEPTTQLPELAEPEEPAESDEPAESAETDAPAEPADDSTTVLSEAEFGHEGYGQDDPAIAAPHPAFAPVPAPSGAAVNEGEPFASAPRASGRRAAEPRRKRLTRGQIAAIATGIVAVIVTIVLAIVLPLRGGDQDDAATSTPSAEATIQDGTPAATVRDLGTALAKGDASAALKLMDVSTLDYDGDDNPLLSDAVYRGAKNRPTKIEVAKESMSVPADDALSAGVTATITQNDKPSVVSLRLTRGSAQEAWKVTLASLPVVQLTEGGGATVEVNGAKAKLPGEEGDYSTARLFVLPGTYSIHRPNAKYVQYPKARTFSASAAALAVAPDQDTRQLGTISLQGKYNAAFRKDARKAADAWLQKCLDSTSTAPKNCPMMMDSTYQGAKVTHVKWDAQDLPTVTFSDSGLNEQRLFGSGGHVTMTGQAKVDGETKDLEAKGLGLDYEGIVKVDGGKVTFTYVD